MKYYIKETLESDKNTHTYGYYVCSLDTSIIMI